VVALQPANKEAHERLRALRGGTVRSAALAAMGARAGATPAELLEEVEALKAKANMQFSAGDKEAACGAYARGLDLLKLVPAEVTAAEAASRGSLEVALLLNSAACALRAGSYAEALSLCDATLKAGPSATALVVKAHFRRGQALEGLGRSAEAEAAYGEVVALQPANKEAHERLRALRPQQVEPTPNVEFSEEELASV